MGHTINRVEVVRLGTIEKHPNADKAGIVRTWGYQTCIQLGEFSEGDLVILIPPDSVVPDRPEYAFLPNRRIKSERIRGVISQGRIMRAPEGAREGDDIAAFLGIKRYEAKVNLSTMRYAWSNLAEPRGPEGVRAPTYMVETYFRYPGLFNNFEEVIVTEKMNGLTFAAVYTNDRMWIRSDDEWIKKGDNIYWAALAQNPWIEAFCRINQKIVVYGEIYGDVFKLRYGAANGQLKMGVFDLMIGNQWIDSLEARLAGKDLIWVPTVTNGPFSKEMLAYANGASTLPGADHRREGIVIKPIKERTHMTIGRVQLKVVSDEHLMKDED